MSPPPRRHTPEPGPRRARSPSDSQRPPPRGARAVAMATPRLAGPVAVLSREGRPPEVGGRPGSCRPAELVGAIDAARRSRPSAFARAAASGLAMDGKRLPPFGARAGLRRAPEASTPAPDPRLPGPPQRQTRPPAISGACERRGHLGLWDVRSQRTGKGSSCTTAPEPQPGRWVRARPTAQQVSGGRRRPHRAGGDRWSGAGAGSPPALTCRPSPARWPAPCSGHKETSQ